MVKKMCTKSMLLNLLVCLCVFLLLTSLSWLSVNVYASSYHFSGSDSVDNGEIRYNDNTRFDIALNHGISAWNNVGNVDLKPDAWNTSADLNIGDFVDCSQSGNLGWWYSSPGADQIKLNLCSQMGKENTGNTLQKQVVTHELGHAYGIEDHYYQEYHYQYSTLMFYTISTHNHTSPQWHDRSDYNQLWGNN